MARPHVSRHSTGVAPDELAATLARDLAEGKYILTGNLTSALFADDCRFVDPNNAVSGLARYRQAPRRRRPPPTAPLPHHPHHPLHPHRRLHGHTFRLH